MNEHKKTTLLLLLLYAVWGFNWVVMRVANDYFPPVYFVAGRFTVGAVTLLLICALRRKLIPPRAYWPWIAITGVLMMAINNLMVQICTKYIGAGLTAVLDYTQSLFVCILASIFLGEAFTIRRAVGVAMSVAGLLILMNVDVTGHLWAIFLGMGAAVIWAISNIIVKTRLQGCDMLQYTAWQMVCGAAVMIAYNLLVPQGEPKLTGMLGIGALLYNGIIASALAFALWNYILSHMEAGKASVAVMGVPAVGVLSGILVLHEPMTWSIALGMVILFAGILIVLGIGEKKTPASD